MIYFYLFFLSLDVDQAVRTNGPDRETPVGGPVPGGFSDHVVC